jgi:hypothetical protein
MNNRQEIRGDDSFNELNNAQNQGMRRYGLGEQDVQTVNFGAHTLRALSTLCLDGRAFSFQDAFAMVRELDVAQAQGVGAHNLSREDVRTPNFGNHSLLAMNILRFEFGVRTSQEAFEMVSGLDFAQTRGMSIYGLTRSQVLTLNFGSHTLDTMDFLVFIKGLENHQQAFQRVLGLTEFQTLGIAVYGFNREQVLNLEFSESILNVMGALHRDNSSAAAEYFYNTAMHLPEYQYRGLAEHQLTLEQVGIAVVDGGFEQDELVNPRFRANHVDAIAHLMETEYMSREQAYLVALNLNSAQITGMIDFGYRLDQVQHVFFKSDRGILGKLIEQLFKGVGAEEWDLNIPLDQEQQEALRNIFDESYPLADLDQGTENMPTTIQNTENEMLSDLAGIAGFASMPLPHKEQSTEEEETLRGTLRGLFLAQSFSSEGTIFYRSDTSDESFEDRKPPAEERKKPKTQLIVEENMEQVGENLQVGDINEFLRQIRGIDILGVFDGIESGTQEAPESADEPIGIEERDLEVGESFRNFAQSPPTAVSFNIVRPIDANLDRTNNSKKRNGKLI